VVVRPKNKKGEYQPVSQHLFVELMHKIKIAVIIYHNTINSAAEKTNITIT